MSNRNDLGLTWMCCWVMSQGRCASSLLSVCRLRSLVGACWMPLSQLSSPPASRKPALCCCTRYEQWCRAAACGEDTQSANQIKPDQTEAQINDQWTGNKQHSSMVNGMILFLFQSYCPIRPNRNLNIINTLSLSLLKTKECCCCVCESE